MTASPPPVAWADLDKLALAKPRADGRVTLVVRDDRPVEQIHAQRSLTVLAAASRVLRGRHVIEQRHGGHGVVVYSTRAAPPEFLVEVVTAAGGVVFDGSREHAKTSLALTVQLDAACIDLATAVRRRLGTRDFAAALDVLEDDVRRRGIDRADVNAYWTAVLELVAVAGELLRASGQPGRWVGAMGARLPLVLELGGGRELSPGLLAQSIVEGAKVSLRSLVGLGRAGAGRGKPFPLLCHPRAVPLERMAWLPLVGDAGAAADSDVPVIVFVEDTGDAIAFPPGEGAPPEALRTVALGNLASIEVELTEVPLPFGRVVVVTGGYFAAETVLHPPTMARVAQALGGATALLVAAPARGYLLAVDAAAASLDDELMAGFVTLIEREHDRATERDRVSPVVLEYQDGRVTTSARAGRSSRSA